MPTRKKATAPSQYWVNHAQEIIDRINNPLDPNSIGFYHLLFNQDLHLIDDVAAFCTAPQPDSTNPTLDDFVAGTGIEKSELVAKAIAYYKLCEEY